jgi:hypothetical protein
VNKQQAQFVRERFLSRFKEGYNVTDPNQFLLIEQILFQAGLDFNDTIRKNLEKAGAIASGDLTDVAVPNVFSNDGGFSLQVGYPIGSKQLTYYDFINQGVKGVGGKNAKPKKNSGKYSYKSKFPNRKMALNIYKWLNQARKTVSADKLDLSKVQKKKRKLKQVLTEADNKKRLAYAISTAIKRDGIRATYYFDRAIKENFGKDFKDALAEALGGDIILQIRSINGNNNNGSTANR